MARYVLVGSVCMLLGALLGAAAGIRAEDPDVEAAAQEAGVSPQDLQGAVNSTGLDARSYLRSTGELASPASAKTPARLSTRAACIIHYESRDDPSAVNPRSGAAGLGQFVHSTWATTPQGRAGLSVFNPAANRAAVDYMLAAGRAREFSVVTAGLC